MNEAIASWRLTGRVCFWCYPKARTRFSGWHFTADRVGCNELIQFIELLKDHDELSHRTMQAIDPQTVGRDQIFRDHVAKVRCASRLRLSNAPQSETIAELAIEDDICSITFGRLALTKLAGAIRQVAQGDGDFGYSFGQQPSKLTVKFWWPISD